MAVRYLATALLAGWLLRAGGQPVAGPIPGVTPALCGAGDGCQPMLIQPSADPNYIPCVQHPGRDCVQGSKVVALAPFDAVDACPTAALINTALTQKSIEDQARLLDLSARPRCTPLRAGVPVQAVRSRARTCSAWATAQISTCINSVRQKPDSFACQYPCDYGAWRDDVVSPVRGPMAFAGNPGTDELNRRAHARARSLLARQACCGRSHYSSGSAPLLCRTPARRQQGTRAASPDARRQSRHPHGQGPPARAARPRRTPPTRPRTTSSATTARTTARWRTAPPAPAS
jgi:hypothetical protein